MSNVVLVVTDEFDAVRYKRKYPDILDGARVLFDKENPRQYRIKEIDKLYCVSTVNRYGATMTTARQLLAAGGKTTYLEM